MCPNYILKTRTCMDVSLWLLFEGRHDDYSKSTNGVVDGVTFL
jgi:hypothetical protein